MTRVVTALEVTRKTLIVVAAVASILFSPRIRASGRRPGLSPFLSICGITVTPVSQPERPSASRGNTSSATAMIPNGLPPPCCSIASPRWVKTVGWANAMAKAFTMTTAFSVR